MRKNDHFTKLENMMHSAPFVSLTGARVKIQAGEAQITLPNQCCITPMIAKSPGPTGFS
jgi:hypothetical protein